ncbi:hypothetical protein [Pseudoduganella chitinolytica]|uniref:Uncharacterized protein n=1 Tax=Pseudoduganella chitinolytica TaxID=34070 RepID=A0ABY8B937_9BURK|nr:hypothetical protein [Pseudoduganella chitinolytica]WEF31943.1 hypothetical protein PX653_21295 [Pseudoduganella chitinolytica]
MKSIRPASGDAALSAFAEEGLIEKRENDRGETYYHVEAVEDGMRFGAFIGAQASTIKWITLRWLDGPCTSKGWDGVSEEALREEYRLLLDFVKKQAGGPPASKRDRQRTWRFKWGHVDVNYEPRDFVVAIFMVFR